jgi:DNA-binding transcriptional LysR family regulator
MRLYATPQYLEKAGPIDRLSDLSRHRLICQRTTSAQVSAGATFVQHLMTHDPASLLNINNYFGVLQAVLNHLGVGVLPDYVIEDFPSIVRVLPDEQSAEIPVFLAYPEELRQSKRVSAFRDFVTEEIFARRQRLRDTHG